MRKDSMLVFDEFLNGSGPFYTMEDRSEALGSYDQLAIQAVVDNVDNAGTLTVTVQNSGDGKNFINKNSTAEISSKPISTAQTTTLVGYDTGARPSLRYVRLSVTLGGGTTAAHVKLWVTCRDQGVGDVHPDSPAVGGP